MKFKDWYVNKQISHYFFQKELKINLSFQNQAFPIFVNE